MTQYTAPNFNVPPSFMGIKVTDPCAEVVITGIPFDYGTVNRAGTRFGPAALREASRMLYDGQHPEFWVDPKQLNMADVGNMPVRPCLVAENLRLIEEQSLAYKHVVALGGDHLVTLPLLRAARKKAGQPLALVHFDAHTDCWPTSFGTTYGHSSVFYHAVHEGLIDPVAYVQIGIRAKTEPYVTDWCKQKNITTLSAMDIHLHGPAAGAERVRAVVGQRPTYLTFDIDCYDPSAAPGTGSPESGGLLPWQGIYMMRQLAGLNFISMDLVEVSPPYDHAEITAVLGATMVFEYLSLLALKAKK
ncbi:MAG: agmatinase [Alphaproteobacteria bacterium]|nr:agmatinase [Alphaproteobacteria bacterium]NDC56498.1 agmatinase [Alphaproteobacteria bacterium]NDG03845.1 agmatinase [Alphaproteobacteria bacterium]